MCVAAHQRRASILQSTDRIRVDLRDGDVSVCVCAVVIATHLANLSRGYVGWEGEKWESKMGERERKAALTTNTRSQRSHVTAYPDCARVVRIGLVLLDLSDGCIVYQPMGLVEARAWALAF